MTENKKHFANFNIDIDIKKLGNKALMINGIESCEILDLNKRQGI